LELMKYLMSNVVYTELFINRIIFLIIKYCRLVVNCKYNESIECTFWHSFSS